METQALLRQVAELLESQEQAIQQHPPETAQAYRKGRDAFMAGQGTTAEEDWMRSAELSLEDVALLHRYMLSSSFMSAWYHLRGQRAQRDKAAHSCALVVTEFGLDAEGVMLRYIDYERLWRRVMKAEGLAPFRPSPLVVLLVLAVAGVLFVILLG